MLHKNTLSRLAISAVLLLLIICIGFTNASPSASTGMRELHRIRLTNSEGGTVEVSVDSGRTYQRLGTVLAPATSSTEGYLASVYAVPGAVAATAVHGIRIKTGGEKNCSEAASRVVSIIPCEFAVTPADFGGYVSGLSGIYTDIHAGDSIFRGLAPFVGNPVFLQTSGGLVPLPSGYVPRRRDVIVIVVQIPNRYPREMLIENRIGGDVVTVYRDGKRELVARVERPVKGIGRFDATGYTGVGRINTNHTGVLTISTAPLLRRKDAEYVEESRGGFMIQPSRHALSYATPPQVLVVAPCRKGDPFLEGNAPLFSGYLGLAYDPTDTANSFRVDVKTTKFGWMPMPAIVGKSNEALMHLPHGKGSLTHLRIRFSMYSQSWIRKEVARDAYSYEEDWRRDSVKIDESSGNDLILHIEKGAGIEFVSLYVDGELRAVTNCRPFAFNVHAVDFTEGRHVAELLAVDRGGGTVKRTVTKFVVNRTRKAKIRDV